jgi:dienelactone hydrolase
MTAVVSGTTRCAALLKSIPTSCAISFFVIALGCIPRESAAQSDSVPALSTQEPVSWMTLQTDSGVVRIAVARPNGRGPFPAILILHGTHGFAEEYVQLARDLARAGVLSIAACWFDRGEGVGQRFITPIVCDGAPRFIDIPGLDRFRVSRITIDALVKKLSASADVHSGKLALFGHSRGGGAALDYTWSNPSVISALVLNSTGYPDEVIARAAGVATPVLIMHGDADDPHDGGSALTGPARARRFEDVLRKGGSVVESKYYPGGHNSLFTDSTQYNDVVRRIADFMRRRARM